jgi:hypothetical protein
MLIVQAVVLAASMTIAVMLGILDKDGVEFQVVMYSITSFQLIGCTLIMLGYAYFTLEILQRLKEHFQPFYLLEG